MSRRTSMAVFMMICTVFSALLFVFSLLGAISLTAVSDRVQGLEKQIEALETENEILLARTESGMSLEDVEHYATQKLHMQPLRPEQIVYIDLADEDMT